MQVFSNSQEAYGALDEELRTAVRNDPVLAQDLSRLDDTHLAAVKQAWYTKRSEQVQIDTGRKRWQGGSTGMDADVPNTNTVPVTRRLYAPEVERHWEALQSGERDLDALPQSYHEDLTDIAKAHGRDDLVARPEQGSGFFKKRLAAIPAAAARLAASTLRGANEIGSKLAQESVRTLPLGTATPRGARAKVQLRPEAISAFAKEVHAVAGQVYGEDPEYRNSLEGMLLEGAVQMVGQMASLGTGLVPQMYDEALQDAEASMGKPLHEMNADERGSTEMMAGLYSVIGGALEYGPLKLITRKLQGSAKEVVKKLADPSIRRELLKGFALEGLTESAQGQVLDELGKHILQDGRDTVNAETIKQRFVELFVGGILGASARGSLASGAKVAQASQAPIAAAEAVAETQIEPQLGQQSAGEVGPTQVAPEPQATKPKASFKIPPRADGEWDVIDYVNELGGIRPPIDRSGGEYDGYNETMGQGVLRMLRNKGGRPVDTLIGELNDSFGTKFESPDELWRALAKAAEDRPKVAERMNKIEHEGKLYAALMENKGRTLAQAATDAVPLSSLRVGESIRVKGEPFEVVELLPDQGEIVLQGEDRLVLPMAESVYVDNNFVDAAPYEPVDPDDPFAMGPSPQEYIADAVEHRKSFAASVLKAAEMPLPKGYMLEGERVTPRLKSRSQQDELDNARAGLGAEGYQEPDAAINKQTETPEFKKWFGDSKVVDQNGKPLVVYHGTAKGGFNQFDTFNGIHGLMGQGSYFTDNQDIAQTYTEKGAKRLKKRGDRVNQQVYPVYLSIQNPLDMAAPANTADWAKHNVTTDKQNPTNEDMYRDLEEMIIDEELPMWEGAEWARNVVESMGYDGITHEGGGRVDKAGVRHRVFIAFEPTQIKSATGNRGTFDPDDPRIDAYVDPQAEAAPPGPLEDAPTVEAPVAPKDDRNYSELPIEMPEMVQMYRDLLGGKYPKVVEKIRALKGKALGVFRHTDGPGGQGEVELRTDLFQLVSEEEKAEMRKRSVAQALAQLNKEKVDVEVQQLAKELYEEQLREATAAAKRKPPVRASKVLAHEIMHLVDWLPQKMIKGRGNILGRIKSAKKFLKSQLNPWEIGPQQTLTDEDRRRLRRLAKGLAAEDLAAAELSPEGIKTDISPEEILNVWNNTNARDTDPDLHDYVARLTPEQKKELVRAAMRENLPKWFTFLRKLENDPTKVTKSEREYYRELLRAEINKRQVFWLEELRAEAEGAIAWWHGMKTIPDYFKTSIEMYAEMGNMLLNNPAAVRERAPKYYDAFMRYRANKPEFSRLYDEIQELMLTGNLQDKRMRDVEAMLQRQAEWAHEADMSKLAFKQSWNRVQGALFREQSRVLSYLDKGSPEIARAKMMMGDYRYRDSAVELMLRRVNEQVFKPIKQAGLSLNDLALYSLHQHVYHNRADIASTLGLNPKASAEQLDTLRKRMSDEQWQALEAARQQWSAVRRDNVLSLLMEAGVLSPETTEVLLERDQYVTFSRGLDAKPNRRAESIRDLIESNFGSHEAGRIYRQNGWLGEIKDPVTATLQKDMALIRMAKREQAKKAVVQGMLEQGSDFIEEASYTLDGKRLKPRVIEGDKVGTLQYQDAGKTKAYYVPREVADFFNSSQSMNEWVFGLFTIPNNITKALFTQNNPGFVPVAFLRDIGSAIMQLPDARARTILPLIPSSMADAARGFLGGNAPFTEQALERGVIISRATPKGENMGLVPGSEALMLRFGINPHAGKGQALPLVEKIGKVWNTIFIPGQIAERTMKIAGMRYLDQQHPAMPESQKAEMIREWAGSPDFLNRGSINPIMETMVGLYYNAAREGIRSFGKKTVKDPWSVGASFLKYVAGPAGVMMLAEMGLLDDEVEEQMKSVPEYDKTNYIIVPIGWEDEAQQKAKYLRLPLFEGHKWMHGAARKLMQVAIEESTTPLKELKEFAGDQFPTENPFLQVLGGLYNFYVSGLNPQDSFTNSPVVTDDAMLTGEDDDMQVWKWVWNKLGGGLIHRFDRKSLNETTTTELEHRLKGLGVQNTLGRFLKVSNRGRIEKAREIGEPLLVDAAKDRQAIEKMLLQMYDQGRTDLTDKQWQWIQQKPYRMQHLKHKWKRADQMRKSFEYRLLQTVPSKAARQAVQDQLLNPVEQ